jgi:ABC-type uncharacterized transport system substrate-binding protein
VVSSDGYTYSSSTSDDDAACALCHQAINGGDNYNPYGDDIRLEMLGGADLVTAILAVEGFNSDGDPCGYSNIDEIKLNTQPGYTVGDPTEFDGTLDPPCGGNGEPTVTNPGTQTSIENDSVALQIVASDPDGDTLTYSALGLPPGLTINSNTGLISGTISYTAVTHPNLFQDYAVEVSVDDGVNDPVTANFVWSVDDLNRDPVAVDDSANTMEDTDVTILVLANDSDADGDSLTVASVTDPTNGSVTNNGTSVTYTPDANYDGSDSFDYTVDDGFGGSDLATVTVNVTATNESPTVETPAAQTNLETDTVSLQIVASDPDGDALSYSASGLPASLSINTSTGLISGTVSYDAVAHPAIQDVYSVTVSVDDSVNLPVSTSFDWTINDQNRAPVAVNDGPVSTVHDSSVDVNVLANDSDADGDSLMVVSVTQPSNGSVTINADFSLTYTPDAGFVGDDSFTYTVEDGFGGSDVATVAVSVTNQAPVAVNDVYSTDQVTTLNIAAPGVLGNDSDADGDALSAVLVSDVSNGTLTLNADGSLTYVPGLTGADSFTYVATDGISDSNVATVTINVGVTNLPPEVVNPGTQTNTEIDQVSLAIVASDPNGDALSYSASGLPVGLSIDPASGVISGTVSYQAVVHPDTAATYAVTVSVDDGSLVSSTSFDWNVDDLNQDPVANDDNATTDPDTAVTVMVLSNDTDADNDTLSVTGVTVQPLNGSVQINGDGSITYTPDQGFVSTDNFTYEIADGFGGTDTAIVTISVVNEAPVAMDDNYSVEQDTVLAIVAPGVLANDSDADGDSLTAVLQSIPSNGSVILSANGSFVYEPNPGFVGSDSFTYVANDGFVDSNLATVTISVNEVGVNHPPVAVDDSYSTQQDSALSIAAPGVLGNDSDVDGDALTAILDTAPSNGVVSLNANGSFDYTPNAGFVGTDSFTYVANDGEADSNVATVTITVNSGTTGGDAFLLHITAPNSPSTNVGNGFDRIVRVWGDSNIVQETTVTLVFDAPEGVSVQSSPASITAIAEPGRPATQYFFDVRLDCVAQGTYEILWTATISAAANDDPSNDMLQDVTTLTCNR